MRSPQPRRTLAMLCLVVFGLWQSLFTSLGVRCTDSMGHSRIELACEKSSEGHCKSSSPHTIDSHEFGSPDSDDTCPDAPCEDRPLGGAQDKVTKAPAPVSVVELLICASSCDASLGMTPLSRADGFAGYRAHDNRTLNTQSLSRLRKTILLI